MRFPQRQFWCGLAIAVAVGGPLAACDTLRSIDEPSDIALWGDNVAPGDLPAPVTKAIRDRFPGAQIHSAERERLGDKVWYDVRIRAADGRYDLQVTDTGVVEEVSRLGV